MESPHFIFAYKNGSKDRCAVAFLKLHRHTLSLELASRPILQMSAQPKHSLVVSRESSGEKKAREKTDIAVSHTTVRERDAMRLLTLLLSTAARTAAFNSLFIGHSFFVPIGRTMDDLVADAGATRRTTEAHAQNRKAEPCLEHPVSNPWEPQG